MTFSQAVHLTLDLFKAFQSLAEIGVMHNDIKESNIFINKGLALIGDFNKSDLC
jgi:serine/threonine protein kinase